MPLDDAELVLSRIALDESIPAQINDRAAHLLESLPRDDLARQLALRELYEAAVLELDVRFEAPHEDLEKCVSVEPFLRHYADSDTRAEWQTIPVRYQHSIALSVIPDEVLTSALPNDMAEVLVPRENSWLIPTSTVEGLDGDTIQHALRIPHADPPYASLQFPLPRALESELLVREPSSIDTLPTCDVVWQPGSVPQERVDRNIKRESCEAVRWRP